MFNTGIGQHILKNPLVVNSIIEKVSKTSAFVLMFHIYLSIVLFYCAGSWSVISSQTIHIFSFYIIFTLIYLTDIFI